MTTLKQHPCQRRLLFIIFCRKVAYVDMIHVNRCQATYAVTAPEWSDSPPLEGWRASAGVV